MPRGHGGYGSRALHDARIEVILDVVYSHTAEGNHLGPVLSLSQGVPMLLGGDEIGRRQGGNNNAYCQDNEISWYDWADVDEELLDFVRRCIGTARSTGGWCSTPPAPWPREPRSTPPSR